MFNGGALTTFEKIIEDTKKDYPYIINATNARFGD
jgi:hypothetical protein